MCSGGKILCGIFVKLYSKKHMDIKLGQPKLYTLMLKKLDINF